jgi:FkbM family methyltransferase
MKRSKIYSITDSFKLFYDDSAIKEGYSISLEEYRCKTFFTKEPETIEWLSSFKDGDVFFDIGANIGQYSIYATIMNRVKVFSFEPFLRNYQRMCENVSLNSASNITPLLVAISNVNGIEKLFIGDTRLGASGSQIIEPIDEKGVPFSPLQEQHVATFSLDDLVKILQMPKPNHIKIDVDGIEDKIINGMRWVLALPTLKSVLIEINSGTREISKILEESGFTMKNLFNSNPSHSRYRRNGEPDNIAENIIFTRHGFTDSI